MSYKENTFDGAALHEVTGVRPTRTGGIKVEIDGELLGEVDPLSFSFSRGDTLTDEQLEAVRDNARRFGARMSAARSLSVQNYTEKGLVRKLRQKGVDQEAAAEAAGYYADRGYIDDMDFAKNKAASLHAKKNYGRRRIFSELMRLGAPQDAAREAVDELPPDREALARALKKRPPGDLSDRRERDRMWRRLAAQGFSPDDIRAALSGDADGFDEEFFYD